MLHEPCVVDVAVVGGGITGALIAMLFADAGIRVALLEARRIGEGSTAANTGLLLQEPDSSLIELTRRYRAAAARRIWRLCQAGTRDFIRLLREREIACDLANRDAVYYTTRHDRLAALKAEFERRREAGIRQRWLSSRMLRETRAIAGPGAICTAGGAQLNPYKACLGLVAGARKAGARIFESSPVRRIDSRRKGVRLVCDRGMVEATHVVIATGYATDWFKPLAGRFQLTHTYVMATKPVSKRVRHELGIGDVMLWDTERPYHYARWTRDHRLLMGGADRPALPRRRRALALHDGIRALDHHFTSIFPTIGDLEVECGWEGLFAVTPDGLPYIGSHPRYPHHLFALGYGGNGMTFAYLAARMLLEQVTGFDSPDHRLFAFNRF